MEIVLKQRTLNNHTLASCDVYDGLRLRTSGDRFKAGDVYDHAHPTHSE
ncbi:hypothetical protein [uncultured Nostoc sp.]